LQLHTPDTLCRPFLRFAGYHPSIQLFELSVLFGLHQSRTRMCRPMAPVLKICEEDKKWVIA